MTEDFIGCRDSDRVDTQPLRDPYVRRAARLVALFAAAVTIGVALLAVSTTLPHEPIRANVAKSAKVLSAEGMLPARFWLFNTFVGDNFTDAVMLSIAMMESDATVGDTFAGVNYGSGGAAGYDQVVTLQQRVDLGLRPDSAYSRYWHGYVVALRLALTQLDYLMIRLLNAILLGLLAASTTLLLGLRNGRGAACAFVIAAVVTAPPILVLNLQFVSVFYVALIGMIAALLLGARLVTSRWDLELFLLLGAATAYVDFLTAPVVTLGLPLLVVLASVVEQDAWRSHLHALRLSATWAVSYVCFWASKWVLVNTMIPQHGGQVGKQIAGRAGASYGLLGRFVPIAKNIGNLVPNTRTLEVSLAPSIDAGLLAYAASVVAIVAILVLGSWLALYRLSGRPADATRRATTFLLVAMLPYAWYFLVAQHSDLHNYFTFRAQAVTVMSIGLFFVYSIDWPNIRVGRAAARS